MRDAAVPWQSFATASGSFVRATTAVRVAKQGPAPRDGGEQVLPILEPGAADNPGRPRARARLSSAAMTVSERMPRARPRSRRIWASAAAAVSSSPKKSATSGAYPPRRADAAKSAAGSGRDQHCNGPIHI